MEVSYTQDQVSNFAQITGDVNPIHIDEEFAARSIFKKRIMHGMLSGTIFSKIFGTTFPGEGTIYLSQYLEFKRPMFVDTVYIAELEVTELLGRHRAKIATIIKDKENGKVTISGEAVLLNSDKFPSEKE